MPFSRAATANAFLGEGLPGRTSSSGHSWWCDQACFKRWVTAFFDGESAPCGANAVPKRNMLAASWRTKMSDSPSSVSTGSRFLRNASHVRLTTKSRGCIERGEEGIDVRGLCCLTFDMSGGPKGAKRPLERPLDGRVRRHARGPSELAEVAWYIAKRDSPYDCENQATCFKRTSGR